jgi:hypothetical protein
MWRNLMAFAVLCSVAFAVSGGDDRTDETRKDEPKIQLKAVAEKGWAGYYASDGKTLEGKPYDGVVLIKAYGSTYLVIQQAGLASLIGIGQVVNSDTLCVGWTAGEPVSTRGCTVYTRKGKTITGRYAQLPTDSRLHEENLTFLREYVDRDKDGEPKESNK